MAKATTADTAGKTKPAKSPKNSGKPAKPNIFVRLGNYFSDVRMELKRVVWPTRNEVVNSSVVVLVTLIFFVVFTFLVDQVVIYVLAAVDKIGG